MMSLVGRLESRTGGLSGMVGGTAINDMGGPPISSDKSEIELTMDLSKPRSNYPCHSLHTSNQRFHRLRRLLLTHTILSLTPWLANQIQPRRTCKPTHALFGWRKQQLRRIFRHLVNKLMFLPVREICKRSGTRGRSRRCTIITSIIERSKEFCRLFEFCFFEMGMSVWR